MNNSSFEKTMENVKKHTCNDRTCNKRKKKKLFGVRTKLGHTSHYYEYNSTETEISGQDANC